MKILTFWTDLILYIREHITFQILLIGIHYTVAKGSAWFGPILSAQDRPRRYSSNGNHRLVGLSLDFASGMWVFPFGQWHSSLLLVPTHRSGSGRRFPDLIPLKILLELSRKWAKNLLPSLARRWVFIPMHGDQLYRTRLWFLTHQVIGLLLEQISGVLSAMAPNSGVVLD